MKKSIILTLMAMALGGSMLAGCGSSNQTAATVAETTEETETATGLANPWTETDANGLLENTGFEMTAPDGATDVCYAYMNDGGMAEMTYTLDDAEWTYRMQYSDELTDISGLYIDWTSEEDDTIAAFDAIYYSDTAEDNTTTNQMVNWYDPVVGVTYSLSVSSTSDISGIDLKACAEDIYQPLQGEATDDAAADEANEITTYFLGERVSSYDGSSITISDNGDGTYKVDISIVGLCSLEDGVGNFSDHKMYFDVTDPNENPMSGMIYRDSDNSLTIKITDSTWDLLPNDEVIEGFGA